MVTEIPDRCPDCERRLARENDFLICACCEFVIDLREVLTDSEMPELGVSCFRTANKGEHR